MRRKHKALIGVAILAGTLTVGIVASYSTPSVPSYLLNSDVQQGTIGNTICKSGWTTTVRPPTSYTNALKHDQLGDPRYLDKDPTHYEEDHWIPLELGGSPRDTQNLWPEPWQDAHAKDVQENRLHKAVCD